MQQIDFTDAIPEVHAFMTQKGWQHNSCPRCGKTFFYKSGTTIDVTNCGWQGCAKAGYPFRALSRRKRMVTPREVSEKLAEQFVSDGFTKATPRNIANLQGLTDLVIAGVQMYDDVVHRHAAIRPERVFVAQPCVRMQFQPFVGAQEGTSTAFVNICSEQMEVTFSEHLLSVDRWCSALSRLGLFMNDFVIVMRTKERDWGTGKFTNLELFFTYGGLEIGDAAYMHIPQSHRAALSVSDIGFGLERITWALNKTDSYYDVLMPWTFEGEREMFDACRTMALLALSGVQASNKGPGLQLRRFAKVLSDRYYREELFAILAHYFDYWEGFVAPSVKKESALTLARLEIERFINLRVCEALALPPPRDETTEAYFSRLVYAGNIGIAPLRAAVKTCKT